MGKVKIVWTAVASAVLALGSVISAVFGSTNAVLAFGLSAVASAILSTKE